MKHLTREEWSNLVPGDMLMMLHEKGMIISIYMHSKTPSPIGKRFLVIVNTITSGFEGCEWIWGYDARFVKL